jgi:hypothetical protein
LDLEWLGGLGRKESGLVRDLERKCGFGRVVCLRDSASEECVGKRFLGKLGEGDGEDQTWRFADSSWWRNDGWKVTDGQEVKDGKPIKGYMDYEFRRDRSPILVREVFVIPRMGPAQQNSCERCNSGRGQRWIGCGALQISMGSNRKGAMPQVSN